VGGGRKGTDHLFHLPCGNQGADIHLGVQCAGIVGNAGQAPGALAVQGSEQVARHTDPAKAGRHEDYAIGNIRYCLVKSLVDFVLHGPSLLRGTMREYILLRIVAGCQYPDLLR
jgi:hypothetical protein